MTDNIEISSVVTLMINLFALHNNSSGKSRKRRSKVSSGLSKKGGEKEREIVVKEKTEVSIMITLLLVA